MSGNRGKDRRSVDMQIMRDWVEPGSRVLDLGCGRGVLLDFLKQTRQIEAVGVDLDLSKITACIKRGLSAYMGDMMDFMKAFPDQHFDRVICSRTLQELDEPNAVINEALRVSKRFTVGFVNYAYWRNRFSMLGRGRRLINEVYPTGWSESRPINPLSVSEFERFCEESKLRIDRKVYLRGDWKREATWFPNWRCGYAIYDLSGSGLG